MQPNRKLIDLGCGNGRDSMYFCGEELKVTAVDSSMDAIASIDKSMPIFAVCDDVIAAKALFCVDYDYAYARWFIHAINQAQQDELLPNIYNSLRAGGLFFVEARTVSDAKYGQGEPLGANEYLFENHYRRFIETDSFAEQLKTVGFEIVYCKQSDSFSVIGDDKPTLVRLVARKP
jgi:cyclopropane fatty-acyl-phospholipid synthase-like methyltransferase